MIMNRFIIIISIFSITLIVVSCKPSQRELAVIKTNEAQKYLDSGDTLKALSILDSLPVLYPKAKFQIDVSKNIKDEIYRQLIDKKKEQLNNINNSITELEPKFLKEKTEFDLYTQYIPLEQVKIRSRNATYLQVNLDERGELFLSSNYYGKAWANHYSVKVYDGSISAETPKVSSDSHLRTTNSFLDYKWEKVSYTEGSSNDVIKFIIENKDKQLKCAFNSYIIFLDKSNIEAIINSYNLSLAIKKVSSLKEEIKLLEKKRFS